MELPGQKLVSDLGELSRAATLDGMGEMLNYLNALYRQLYRSKADSESSTATHSSSRPTPEPD